MEEMTDFKMIRCEMKVREQRKNSAVCDTSGSAIFSLAGVEKSSGLDCRAEENHGVRWDVMNGIAALIVEWLNDSPRRTPAGLSRATGVPRSTIHSILAGRKPTIEVSIKLSRALPRKKVLGIVCQELPELADLIDNLLLKFPA